MQNKGDDRPDTDTLSLNDVLERYATLRDTILGLEDEKNKLGEVIKQALLRGEQAESDLYRASIKVQRRVEYPTQHFREVFGDAAALEVSTIDKKTAEALARAGDLDASKLRSIAKIKEVSALVLTPKDQN